MIPCSRFDDLFRVSLDLPLGPGLRAEFDEHLIECAACLARMEGYVASVEILLGLGGDEDLRDPPPLPESLVQRLLSACRADRDAKRHGDAIA